MTAHTAMAQEQDGQTRKAHDEIILKDGRRFVGDIVEETDESIKVSLEISGIKTTQIWSKQDIERISYDIIPIDKKEGGKTDKVETDSSKRKTAEELNASLKRGQAMVVIPFKGVVGYDAYKDFVQDLWDDAIEEGARTVVFEFECQSMLSGEVEQYRDFFKELKQEAKDNEIEVVVWLKEALGMSIAYALMFETIYCHPDGLMGGGWVVDEQLKQSWSDKDVQAKMIAAWVGICRGMAENGGYNAYLCEAMIRPELVLSFEYDGETPIFYRDTEHNVIDDNPTLALELNADDAERWGISRGTCRSMRELAKELNHREYYEVDFDARNMVELWIDGWRRALQREVPRIFQEMAMVDGYNEPADKKLGMKLNLLRELRKLVIKWPPLQKVSMDLTLEYIDLQIEAIKKQLRDLRNPDRGGGGGGGGGGSGRGKGGGGG
ncbi:MAG: hypothetical protein D8M59_02565 [Planctomycetes bacterium]|nr:hypothetical protein [Planctomycetota bacterium]